MGGVPLIHYNNHRSRRMIQPATASPSVATTSRFQSEHEVLETPTLIERVWSSSPRIVWWGAIVAGAIAAIAIQVIFAILGTALGLTVVGGADDASAKGLSIAGAIYWLITGLISLYIGGMIAGRMRGTADRGVSAMHGFLAWCTVTVLSMLMLVVAGGAAIGGSLGILGDTMADNARTQNIGERTEFDRSSTNTPAGERQPDLDTRDNATLTTPRITEDEAKEAARNA